MTNENQTTWQDRRDFEERLNEGVPLSFPIMRRLIEEADAGERAAAILEGLKKALKTQLGIAVVDSTTDDDDGEIRIDLVQEVVNHDQ